MDIDSTLPPDTIMTQAGAKHDARPFSSRLYTSARAILIGFASLYALAVICVMTPLIQTQFGYLFSSFFLQTLTDTSFFSK
jgi:hypothetical protein